MVWAGVLVITHHEVGKHVERVFKKILLKPNAASHNNASWYTGTEGFLEHSPSRGSLYYKGPTPQKIIPVFSWGSPLYTTVTIPEMFLRINDLVVAGKQEKRRGPRRPIRTLLNSFKQVV